jgi:hypothetical protein
MYVYHEEECCLGGISHNDADDRVCESRPGMLLICSLQSNWETTDYRLFGLATQALVICIALRHV